MTPHALPVQLTTFLGRVDEVAAVTRLLHQGRLVTVTGAGGAGKTRLAIEAARRFDSGPVWFVELSPIVDGALIPSVIATAAGIAEVAGESPLETLASTLRAAHALLLLDNCEHLLVPCAVAVAHLLQACPSLAVLATSREPLNLSGEVVQRLSPLALSDAATLFVERASAAEPGFAARPNEPALLESICGQLDGLPLAIELAAPHVRFLSLSELAARLGERLELLQSRTPTGASRHHTLKALADWSYELLSPGEQRLYRRLSVFAGGCTLDAVEAICRDEAGAEANLLPLLRALVEKSLVLAEEQDGETRYRMLETLRQHSRAKLLEAGEDRELSRRHLGWFRDLAEQAELGLRDPDPDRWHRRLQVELENCRVALAWSRSEPEQLDNALRLAAALGRFWRTSGHASEAFEWLTTLLSAAPPNATRAKALEAAGWLALRRGEPDSQPFLDEALVLARALDEWSIIVATLKDLAFLRLERGDPVGALAALDEGMTVAETPELNQWRRILLRLRGLAVAAMGQPQEGIAYLREAVRLAREQRDLNIARLALRELGALLLDLGELAEARLHLEDSLASETRRPEATETLGLFVGLAVAEGDLAGAVRLAGAVAGLKERWPDRIAPYPMERLKQHLEVTSESLSPATRQAVWAEGAVMSWDEAIGCALRRGREGVTAPERRGGLTPRQMDVVGLVARGLSNHEIATALVMSEGTVKRHVENVLARLGLSSRREIMIWVAERRVLAADAPERVVPFRPRHAADSASGPDTRASGST